MRTFAMSDKSYLPLGSANSAVGYTLVLTGILWIVLLVSVFVERSRTKLLVPINISMAFFAFVLFYYVFVCIRQHLLLNKHCRSHSTLLGREGENQRSEHVLPILSPCHRDSRAIGN
jgi:hypothetical protein